MLQRRTLLKSAGAFSALAPIGAFAPFQALAATTAGAADYRALVCVFMFGGNDANNMIVPSDAAGHALYAKARPNLALQRDALVALGSSSYGAHPAMGGLARLYGRGQAAVVANVGPLVVPTTRAQFEARSVPLPLSLFSHSDQQGAWQSALVEAPARNGWGGRLLERLVASGSSNRGYSAISLSGSNLWQGGDQGLAPYRVSSSGRFGFDFYEPAGTDPLSAAISSLLAEARTDPFEQTWLNMMGRSIDNQRLLTGAINSTSLTTAFPDTGLGRQLQMAARLIGARTSLGLSRQCFFCSIGGFDTHGDDQLQRQNEQLGEISSAVSAFHAATVEMGVGNQATLFTASDFGRTLASNGMGTDHGWGAHQWVVGGAVKGGQIVGRFPNLAINGPDDSGQGVWIPTTSVDQLGGELGRWFGADVSLVDAVFPKLVNFDRNLGLMNF